MADPNLTPGANSAMPSADMFAAAWLERWLANGGTVHVAAEAAVTFHRTGYARDLPGHERPPAHWSEA